MLPAPDFWERLEKKRNSKAEFYDAVYTRDAWYGDRLNSKPKSERQVGLEPAQRRVGSRSGEGSIPGCPKVH